MGRARNCPVLLQGKFSIWVMGTPGWQVTTPAVSRLSRLWGTRSDTQWGHTWQPKATVAVLAAAVFAG